MSFSDASEAEPRSHNFKTVLCSFTWYNNQQVGGKVNIIVIHTKILSGLISACMIFVFRNKLKERKS